LEGSEFFDDDDDDNEDGDEDGGEEDARIFGWVYSIESPSISN
jgi:hypothetical protein